MAAFHDFLTPLLDHGRIVFRSAKAPHDRPTERDVVLVPSARLLQILGHVQPPSVQADEHI